MNNKKDKLKIDAEVFNTYKTTGARNLNVIVINYVLS